MSDCLIKMMNYSDSEGRVYQIQRNILDLYNRGDPLFKVGCLSSLLILKVLIYLKKYHEGVFLMLNFLEYLEVTF